jgi:phytoene dehydrogenase-like protein
MSSTYDVVVVGAGHNGLVSAAYLARAGLRVLVLERLASVGGAAASATAFDGHPARLPRYASLVSSMPPEILEDLGADVRLAPRPMASYAPVIRDGKAGGLVVEQPEGRGTRNSFIALTGGGREYDVWCSFYGEAAAMARVVAPTLLQPLPTERTVSEQVDPGTWREFVTVPLGQVIERRFADDTVRGIVAADALRGTFTSMGDDSLAQNRAFLYSLMGHGPGAARVPVGGMGALSDALAASAARAGAEIRTNAGVSAIRAGDGAAEVSWDDASGPHTVQSRFVLADVAPWVLHILMGEPDDLETKPEGAQVTVSFLLDRLPRLKSGMDPAVAFAGTFHVASDYSTLEATYADAAAGRLPATIPSSLVCHTLTDRSILGSAATDQHTLTLTTLHTPASLFGSGSPLTKGTVVARAISALDAHLAEPLESCLSKDAAGRPCIDARVPQDIEQELAMPGGHPNHGDLDWPWASNRARLDTAAQQWGVQTDHEPVLLCGAGARRGGGVSGIGGHNAAQAVLASV